MFLKKILTRMGECLPDMLLCSTVIHTFVTGVSFASAAIILPLAGLYGFVRYVRSIEHHRQEFSNQKKLVEELDNVKSKLNQIMLERSYSKDGNSKRMF